MPFEAEQETHATGRSKTEDVMSSVVAGQQQEQIESHQKSAVAAGNSTGVCTFDDPRGDGSGRGDNASMKLPFLALVESTSSGGTTKPPGKPDVCTEDDPHGDGSPPRFPPIPRKPK